MRRWRGRKEHGRVKLRRKGCESQGGAKGANWKAKLGKKRRKVKRQERKRKQ